MHARIPNGRVAIYARFSSDNQREASIADQLRRCREYIAEAGGDPEKALVFQDRAISGASLDRPGFELMMQAVDDNQIDVVITEDLSRISRDFADAALVFRKLRFAKVPLIGIADGIDTSAKDAKLSFTLKSLVVDLYLDDLRDKTKRGLAGRAIAGYSTGSKPYGYGSEPTYDDAGRKIGYRLHIIEERAAIIRRIFQECANGRSRLQIVRLLNAEGVPCPTSHKRPTPGGWSRSTIRSILNNERYIGIWRYREVETIKQPGSNKRIRRKQDTSKVLTFERPELRIIEQMLWQTVRERLAGLRRKYKREDVNGKRAEMAGNKSRYLLSGLLACGVCGGSMTIRSNGGARRSYYRCDTNRRENGCENKKSIREDLLRPAVLEAICDRLMSDDGIAYVRTRLADEVGTIAERVEAESASCRARIARTEERIRGLVEFIAQGQRSEYISERLRELEASAHSDKANLQRLERALRSPTSLPSVEDVTAMVFDLEARLADDPDHGRQVLRQWLDGSIKMTPTAGGRYRIEGRVLPTQVLGSVRGSGKRGRERARKAPEADPEAAPVWPNVHDTSAERRWRPVQRKVASAVGKTPSRLVTSR